ncbi:MAG: hypothetical protein Q8M56_11635, partial [Desulfobacterales bacterium]|nr:hypothetical protein [Desulfobacterales bacterium]
MRLLFRFRGSRAISFISLESTWHSDNRCSSRYLMPERMKLWTNWRWNSRKAIRSGETASSVPAEITEKLTPDSGAP